MAATIATTPLQGAEPRPHRFTLEDYHRMGEAGIFGEDDRVELLEGEIYDMSPSGDPHAGTVNRSTESFVVQLVGTPFMASIQNPIRLPNNSEPQPDLAVVRRSVRGVADAVDVLLVVEVADSSRAYDRGKKLQLYAAAGIPEVWLVDLVAQTIERYTDPREGRYRQLLTVSRGERLAATALPNLTIAVDDLLG